MTPMQSLRKLIGLPHSSAYMERMRNPEAYTVKEFVFRDEAYTPSRSQLAAERAKARARATLANDFKKVVRS